MPTIEIPDHDDLRLIFKAVKALHRRIVLLENKQTVIARNMAARYKAMMTLKNRYYGQAVRRQEADKRRLDLIKHSYKKWQRHLSDGSIQRLSMILSKVGKRRIIPTMTPQQNAKFRNWLKRDFRVRRA